MAREAWPRTEWRGQRAGRRHAGHNQESGRSVEGQVVHCPGAAAGGARDERA